MFRIYDGRETFYQWDLDRKLVVNDNSIKEVHFCNKTDDCSLVCEVYTEDNLRLVNVPNVLLQDNWRINVYGYDDKYTKHEKQFNVKGRTKPADYVYTETECKTFEALEKRMEELENTVDVGIEKAVEDYLKENPVEVDLTGLATEEYVNSAIGAIDFPETDLTGYAKEVYVDEAIANIDFPETDLSNYYTKQETDTEINKAKPDLSPYALKTEIPNIEGLATEDYVNQQIEAIPEVDLTNYYTKQETDTAIEEVETIANEANVKVDTLREVVSKFHSNIVSNAKGEVISINDSSSENLEGLTVYGKSVQNGTPSPEAPIDIVSVGNSVAITVCGKNMFDVSTYGLKIDTIGLGITGKISVASGNGSIKMPVPVTGKPISISFDSSIAVSVFRVATSEIEFNGNEIATIDHYLQTNNTPITFTPSKNAKWLYIQVSSAVFDSAIQSLQIELGTTATAYEPHKGQTLTLSTPTGLPGIPVSSGGNYTDSTGQQWICDYVDFAKGVYVQRVNSKILTTCEYFVASDNIAYFNIEYYPIRSTELPCLSDKLQYDTNFWSNKALNTFRVSTTGSESWKDYARATMVIPSGVATTSAEVTAWIADQNISVLFPLYESIETALTAEELAQYAELHTNYPNTTIFTDSNAGLEVDYIADTKLYIDNKFNELATVLIAN